MTSKRSTVYIEEDLHRALRLKAAEADRSISDLVNEAVRLSLAEDHDDLASLGDRISERSVSFESVVRKLKRDGRI